MSFFKRKGEHHREDSLDKTAETAQGPHHHHHQHLLSKHAPNTSTPPSILRQPGNPSTPGQHQRQPSGGVVGPIQRQGPSGNPHHGGPPPANTPSYPWSTRQLVLSPSAAVGANPNTLVSPFPRYGMSLPPIPTQSGHLLIFGGLVREAVRNDLFALDCHDFSALPIQATGEIPIPRVGHASALVRSVLLVWGGDTKTRLEEDQDEAIYLFNIHTREWTRILAPGHRPKGRYGHAACMHANTFYVSGGQVDGQFMSDLWGFDLSTLMASPTWHFVKPVNQPPPSRTGHVMVIHQEKLYIFGGTDGAFHYNDTWSLDLKTRVWTELQCIGYIPVPREGHSAAMVDDVMYVFGGRDVNGKDLGDLAAFKITNRRWYTFQNMGPAPSGRSGHAMAAAGNQVFVLGGDSNAAFAQSRSEDPNIIHVLDTGKIKYPVDPTRPPPSSTSNIQPSGPVHDAQSAQTYASGSHHPESMNPAQLADRHATSSPSQAHTRSMSNAEQQSINAPSGPRPEESDAAHSSNTDRDSEQVLPASHQQAPLQLEAALPPKSKETVVNEPPMRPRREDDELFAQQRDGLASPRSETPERTGHHSLPSEATVGAKAQRMSMTNDMRPLSPISPSGGDEFARRHLTGSVSSREPPADAFYYGPKSPTGTIRSGRAETPLQQQQHNQQHQQQHQSSRGTDDMDSNAPFRENVILKAALERALQEGVSISTDTDLALDSISSANKLEPSNLLSAILHLQEQCATLKTELTDKVEQATQEYAELEHLRDGALQEAAYLRARMAISEHGNTVELVELDRERMSELQSLLATSEASQQDMHAQTLQLAQDLDRLHEQLKTAKEQGSEAFDRAQDAEERQAETLKELHRLQTRLNQVETELRDHLALHAQTLTTLDQHKTDLGAVRGQFDSVSQERDGHRQVIAELRTALQAAEQRLVDVEETKLQVQGRMEELQQQLEQVNQKLSSQNLATEAAERSVVSKEKELEAARSEAKMYRSLTEDSLGRLLSSNKTRESSQSNLSREMISKTTEAQSQECASLRKMLNEAGAQIDSTTSNLMQQRQEIQELMIRNQQSQKTIANLRLRAETDNANIARLTAAVSARDLAKKQLLVEVSELKTRCFTMRELLNDQGIVITDPPADIKDKEVQHAVAQSEVADQTRQLEKVQQELAETRLQLQQTRNEKGARLADGKPPIDAQQSLKIQELEDKLANIEIGHRKKLQQVESDYQTAVRYVKGTEKVFRRMKDELTKQKNVNTSLQAELDSVQGTNGAEAGSRTRTAMSGRITPTAEGEQSRQHQRLQSQNKDLQRQLDGVNEELAALRDVCAGREKEVDITRKRIRDSEHRVATLQKELQQYQHDESSDGRTWRELEQDNIELRQENETLSHQVMLLLADDDRGSLQPQSGYDFSSQSHSRPMEGSSIGELDHSKTNT